MIFVTVGTHEQPFNRLIQKIDENDHQVEFARNVAQKMGTIIPVEDIESLGDIITNYDQIVADMGHGMSSNNEKFNEEFEKMVDELFCGEN